MTNPLLSPNYQRPSGKQIKVVQGAQTRNTVAVAPVARSVAALLMAAGVPDEHLDGCWEMFLTDERFMNRNPEKASEIAADVREVYATYLAENIDAV
jgi:hypothetical protein